MGKKTRSEAARLDKVKQIEFTKPRSSEDRLNMIDYKGDCPVVSAQKPEDFMQAPESFSGTVMGSAKKDDTLNKIGMPKSNMPWKVKSVRANSNKVRLFTKSFEDRIEEKNRLKRIRAKELALRETKANKRR